VLPNGDRHLEVDPRPLTPALIRDLRRWVVGRLPHPSEGTGVVLDYLREIEPSLFVRGHRRVNDTTWQLYVQVSFSGCAGEAETSARAAVHLASFWYAAEHERLASEHLVPYGFTPDPYDPARDDPGFFLPAADLGYLEYVPPTARLAGEPAFSLDHSLREALEGDARLDRLEELYERFMADGRCKCQICQPDFGDATVEVAG
jgi:hypothetical protein